MTKTVAYDNIKKYCNRICIDETPIPSDKVLVPIWIQDGYILPAEYQANLTTYHIGGFKFLIGFIPVATELFATYMRGFWQEINDYVKERREGRCIIGYKSNGAPICCPKSKRCTNCPEKHDHLRYNPLKDQYQILSLDYCYEDEEFDYPDENTPTPEALVCSSCCLSSEEYFSIVIEYFERTKPRYATIMKLCKQRVPIEDICNIIGLKRSRGREEIHNAYDALNHFLKYNC